MHNPTVYGSFMSLAGIQNETVDLEVLKSPQVVASYVKFTDINMQKFSHQPSSFYQIFRKFLRD